ncbi:ATP-dependent DNA helicase Q-like SIM isoform X1 [Trifolium pratense]|uniref:ATP-dependent DNA helicase Q-like SIM isoform X1 n=2 Tax=Trifolium pratense TaxID=57577 RepID=UPI001E694106|nr:ATP-dependent DNA helicase Q-like SIM isoform X1 [Trifolium pratense]
MDSNNKSSDQVISEMVEMGFEHSKILEAIKVVGLSIPSIVDHIFNTSTSSSSSSNRESSTTHISKSLPSNGKALKKRTFSSSLQVPKSKTINHYFQSSSKVNEKNKNVVVDVNDGGDDDVEEHKESLPQMGFDLDPDVASDWEMRASILLQKHFGFSSLKSFQKEALSAWISRRDCLVLAATGSGKSLCFQIPALLTGKVVVVISPLISLMHDQCLKLTKHGISACFLGSGQPDNTVEKKAMSGMYSIVYICPETVLRLIQPLQKLAESHGIALFAIDEVHCVSKWGHDFRPAYSRLSALRENFTTGKLKSLKFDIPVMALTATATKRVREDILKSLRMSKDTSVVLTSFFRPNLRFMVKHSRTSWASYESDFHELIKVYGGNKKAFTSDEADDVSNCSDASDTDSVSSDNVDDNQDDYDERDISSMHARNTGNHKKRRKLTIEFLENDVDVFQSADDLDVTCGEFCVQPPPKQCELSETVDPPAKPEKRLKMLKEPLERGPTIIYVPTRKDTVRIAKYLCKSGVKAAAYNAGLPKLHLRRTHKEFHENTLEVVVATIAFGMGIDKSNVRRIIHYGWPQSLEAYYQEAGRAGRDGKLADCILYANLARKPSLLPSRRSEEMTKLAYIMLSDCFRYGMNTSCCRAKTLVEYFGEDFSHQKCLLCDVCTNGPPQRQNLKEEACILLQTIGAHNAHIYSMDSSYNDDIHFNSKDRRLGERPSLMTLVRSIREQFQKFLTTDILWWRGLSRILEAKGYIREGDDKTNVQIKYPELTELGLEFVKSMNEETFYVYPEADMLLETKIDKPFSSFSEWGKGWADPEIRRQRLERMQQDRSPTKRKSPRKQKKRRGKKVKPDLRTSRGRLTAKLTKHK